jgi:hypothetical protein
VLWVGMHSNFMTRMLSVKPLVVIGKMSYSIYLYHWPAICFSLYIFPRDFESAGAWAITALASTASFYYVETPLRKNGKVLYIAGGSGATCVCALTLFISLKPMEPMEPLVWDDYETTLEDVQNEDLKFIGRETGEVEVLLWGDSHAMAFIPGVDRWLKERGTKGLLVTHVATAPVLGLEREIKHGITGKSGPEWSRLTVEYIREHKIPNVFIIAYWGEDSYALVPAVIESIRAGGNQTKVWIGMDVPNFKSSNPSATIGIDEVHGRQPDILAIKRAGGRIIDPRPYFLSEDGKSYVMTKNGTCLYRDDDHLSVEGSYYIVYETLVATLR